MKSKSDFFMLGLKKSFIIVSNFEIFWSIPWHDIPAKQIFSIKLTSRIGTPRLGRHGLILIHQFCETGLWTFCALPYGPYDMEEADSHLPIIKNKNLKNCIWQFAEIKCDFSSVRKSSIADTAVGRLYGRAKRRPVNLTTKQSSELNSVGPETPKSMKFFWFGPLPVMTSSPLIRLQRSLPPSSDPISKNENRTL